MESEKLKDLINYRFLRNDDICYLRIYDNYFRNGKALLNYIYKDCHNNYKVVCSYYEDLSDRWEENLFYLHSETQNTILKYLQ